MLKFFCDENITKRIYQTINKAGYQVDSVRTLKKWGISNGDLFLHLDSGNYTYNVNGKNLWPRMDAKIQQLTCQVIKQDLVTYYQQRF